MPAKNPHRQLAQYRRMIRSHRRLLAFTTILWFAPTGVLVAALIRDWHVLIEIFAGIAIASGLVEQAKVFLALRDYSRKARGLEAAGVHHER